MFLGGLAGPSAHHHPHPRSSHMMVMSGGGGDRGIQLGTADHGLGALGGGASSSSDPLAGLLNQIADVIKREEEQHPAALALGLKAGSAAAVAASGSIAPPPPPPTAGTKATDPAPLAHPEEHVDEKLDQVEDHEPVQDAGALQELTADDHAHAEAEHEHEYEHAHEHEIPLPYGMLALAVMCTMGVAGALWYYGLGGRVYMQRHLVHSVLGKSPGRRA